MTKELPYAAHDYVTGRYKSHGMDVKFVGEDLHAAFEAGAAWAAAREVHKEAETVRVLGDAAEAALDLAGDNQAFQNEMRDAIGRLAEGVAFMLRQQQDLAAMGLRGADRGVAILKHLQEIGDNVRGVSGSIGDKFGVLKDAIEVGTRNGIKTFAEVDGVKAMIVDVGQKVEAVLDQVMPHDVAAIETAQAHYDAGPSVMRDAIPTGKTSTVSIADVDDATLKDLATTEQIDGRLYWQEVDRRQKARLNKLAEVHMALDPAMPGSDKTVIATSSIDGMKVLTPPDWAGDIVDTAIVAGVLYIACDRGIFRLHGDDLIPLRFRA